MAGPDVGDPAPDALLVDLEHREIRLSRLWNERPAVVVFLRYFGCPFCQTQVVNLRNEHDRILGAGATVGLIGHGDPEAAIAFASSKGTAVPAVAGPGPRHVPRLRAGPGEGDAGPEPQGRAPVDQGRAVRRDAPARARGRQLPPDARDVRDRYEGRRPSTGWEDPDGAQESGLRRRTLGRTTDRGSGRDGGVD